MNFMLNGTEMAKRRRVRPEPDRGKPATVTVVIPCYNYANYLPAAVNSALDQTGVAVDVVIVDDCSKDDSLAVAEDMASRDDRIKVLAHVVNRGPVATFNDGLAVATGEFLVRLDADDLLTPGALQRAVAVFRRFPSVGLVYGHPVHFTKGDPPQFRRRPTAWTIWPGRQWLSDRCDNGYNVITSPEAVMRKSVVDRVGGQKDLAHTHDMEMWFRIAAFSDVAYIHGADQAYHRDHAASLSARKVDTLRDLNERMAAFNMLFSGPAGGIPGARRMRAAGMRAVARHALRHAAREYDHGRRSPELVEALIGIAKAAVDDLTAVPGWKGFQRRMRRGPSKLHPAAILSRLSRNADYRISNMRWKRSGIF